MRNQLIYVVLAVALGTIADGQTREVFDGRVLVSDASGRYVRLEGDDGVVVNYLYDTPEAEETTGMAVRVNDRLTLTVRYDGSGGFAVVGLPALTSVLDHEGRTAMVQADQKAVALFDYTASGLVAAVTLPARLVWKISAPDASGRVRQSVENASGKVIATAMAKLVDSGRPAAWYHAAAAELGVSLKSLRYDQSVTGAVTTARHANGRVAFYVVHTDRCSVGFSPDGTPRFYDLTLSVFGGSAAPGSDLIVSPAWDAQRGAVPDHFVLTASGTAGLYAEVVAEDAIGTAWADRAGTRCSVITEDEVASYKSHRQP